MDVVLDSPSVRFETFGGLKVFLDGSEIAPGPPRQQLALGLLLAARGRSVSVPNIIDALWSDAPPASAVNQLHRYVGELRRSFEPDLKPREIGTILLPSANGYRIDLGRVACDLEDFYGLAESAALARKRKANNESLALYESALDVSLLPFLANLAAESVLRPEFASVERERLAIAIAAADVALSETFTADFLSRLETIAASAPLNEPLQARVIRLLTLSGRRSDAVAHFAAIRSTLADLLGVDPGHELQDAHLDALRAESPEPGRVASRPLAAARSLPPRRAGFIHRQETTRAFEDLETVLALGTSSSAVISGMAGIGKTTLAINWAHDISQRFPDGQLYINLQGYGPPDEVRPTNVARNCLLESMGEDLAALDSDANVRQARYQHILETRRLLIVLDNARDSDQVRPLLAAASGSFTIVTSRNQLSSILVREGAASYTLGRWSQEESRLLLTSRLGAKRAAVEDQALSAMAEACGGLPLALAILTARAAMQPSVALQHVAAQVTSPHTTLDYLATDEPEDNLRQVFAWSYGQLSPDAAMAFTRLAAYPGTSLSPRIAATTAGVELSELGPVLRELLTTNMLVALDDGAYVIHDLLQLFALELLSDSEREAAETRLIVHYSWSARNAWLTAGLSMQLDPIPEAPAPVTPDDFPTMAEWSVWYQNERGAIFALLERAWERSDWLGYASIVVGLRPLSLTVDTYEFVVRYSLRALEAAETSGELAYVAECCRDLGVRSAARGEQEEAKRYLHRALRLFTILQNSWGIESCSRTLSEVAGNDGDPASQLRLA
ncbi:BTAD domain-containing putative transcriptional regulator [Lacisediminihabitans sp.]|uniref:AfsR/SARP family transcriptional regulator n=1 Tax=Lacisediminihabitans sp. TaxID=2787631 RepID=UPI00374DA675